MKKILTIIFFCLLLFNPYAFADNEKSCSDEYSFKKVNRANYAFPIFQIESTSSKKIKIKKFGIEGHNNETIYEKNISLIIDPYSIETFEPFNYVSGLINNEKIPNLNPKVIKNYYLTCEWYDEKSSKKNVKNKIIILICSGNTVFYPKFPTTYEEALNDDNFYYAIGEKKILFNWDWKLGKFLSSLPIKVETKGLIMAITKDFWNTENENSKYIFTFDKYSMIMTSSIGYIDKNLFTKDEIKLRIRDSKCSTIDINKLGKLKPRID